MSLIRAIQENMSISLTRKVLLITIFVATALITLGYALGKLWVELPVIILLGVLWGVAVLRELRQLGSIVFVVLMAAAAVGYMIDLSHLMMLAAGCAVILAWDLQMFEGRLLDLEDPTTLEMEKDHLLRSLAVLGGSFLVVALGSLLEFRIRFLLLVLVAIITILLLNQIMMLIRRIQKPKPPKE